jgi:DNA polymerase III epsilon subunit family exonuclease
MSCTSTPANSAIFTLSRFSSEYLDDTQRKNLFHTLKRNATRWKPTPQQPTVEEWKEWLTEVSEQVRTNSDIPSYSKSRIISRLDRARFDDPPKGADFAALKYFEKQLVKSKYALRDQASQIGAWYGVGYDTVQDTIQKYREEYLEAPKNNKPHVPESYVKGWRNTSPNVPKDEATIYGHWKAEDPSNYELTNTYIKYVAMDLETTGISTKDSHIIEIGCVIYDNEGNELERWQSFVKPPANENGEIDTGPVHVHGIKPEDLSDAPTFEELAPEIERKFKNTILIGHNVSFDTKHLRVSFNNLAEAKGLEKEKMPWISAADTYWKAARHHGHLENSKLATIAKELGISYTDGHRALHDAAVSGEVFFKLREDDMKKIPKN